MSVSHAIVRTPTVRAGAGLTTAGLGAPDIDTMLAQHRDYVAALESLGLQVTVLAGDESYPDSHFIEDTAVITPDMAVITRPGAASRRGEEAAVEPLLAEDRPVARIASPGTVDGGDIVVLEETAVIGLSARTNEEGARQLAGILEEQGLRCISVQVGDGLHLKSSINALAGNRLLVTQAFSECGEIAKFERVVIPAEESYAGNSLWINDHALVPAGFPQTRSLVEALGIEVIELDVSEFRKMDGGLTCLSIRL